MIRLQVVPHGIKSVAIPSLLFFISENQLLELGIFLNSILDTAYAVFWIRRIDLRFFAIICSFEDHTGLGSFPPLPTQINTSAGNTPGKSSYANVVGKPSGKKLNIRTMFTPRGRGSMDGLDFMLENGPWFIRNNPLILKRWHPDENLLKEDVSIVPVSVKLHGVPVTAFSEDGLSAIATKLGTPLMLDSYTSNMCMQCCGRSRYTRVMIELRADVELKDNIVVAMPRVKGEGHYICNVHVEHK
nr:hypothetical protein [Tanacetum cinerariifolium]